MLRKQGSQIVESQSIRDILKLISFDSWVLLDLDNTVMESLLELGSDQWFTQLIEHACQLQPGNTPSAVAEVITIYHAVQHHIRTKAVEPSVVNLIKALQDCGIPVIGLTARDRSLIDTTFRQLDEIGIDFSRNRPSHEPVIELGDNPKNTAIYHSGIIFCSGNDKGKCFLSLLEKCKPHPRHIVMGEDKEKHLIHVRAAAESKGMRFDGLRYGFLDAKVKDIQMKKAHIQLAHIKDKLPPLARAAIDKLQIDALDVSTDDTEYAKLFAPDPTKKSSKRKRHEILHIEKALPPRPQSAISFFSEKQRYAAAIESKEPDNAASSASPSKKSRHR
jgi:hypothetical protein